MTDYQPDEFGPDGYQQAGDPESYDPRHSQPVYTEAPEGYEDPAVYQPGGRRKKSSRMGCLPALIGLLVVALVVAFAVWKGVTLVKDRLGGPEDYAGKGHGSVVFEVHKGDTSADIGRGLKSAGVVKSVDAFLAAAEADPRSKGIQVGSYEMKEEMSGEAALAILVNPDNLIKNRVTIPEGLRVTDTVDLLVDKTGIPRQDFETWLDKADQLGLPDFAEGNPEGYLFPATYDLGAHPTAKGILSAMIKRWQQAAEAADLEEASQRLGYTPAELMVVASLVQSEARGDDMPKVARVIYNRLENPGTAGTNGRLQIDATVNFALDRKLGVALTEEDLQVDSPYNTYQHVGLPPGPIENPGDAAIQAATHPAEGDWYYYVTVNLRTGETKFAETYDEFLEYKAEFKEYCETSDAC